MKKILIAGVVSLMCSSAFAQGTTGPAPQGDNMTKPGMNNGTMDKGGMNNTTGMNKDGMSKDGMSKNDPSKEMSKDGSNAAGSKDMKK